MLKNKPILEQSFVQCSSQKRIVHFTVQSLFISTGTVRKRTFVGTVVETSSVIALKNSHTVLLYVHSRQCFTIHRLSVRDRCSMSQLNTRCSANIPPQRRPHLHLNLLTASDNQAIGRLWEKY